MTGSNHYHIVIKSHKYVVKTKKNRIEFKTPAWHSQSNATSGLRIKQCQRPVFLSLHYLAFARAFIVDSTQMKHSVDYDA